MRFWELIISRRPTELCFRNGLAVRETAEEGIRNISAASPIELEEELNFEPEIWGHDYRLPPGHT